MNDQTYHILENRNSRTPNYSYKLGGSQYGLDVAFIDRPNIDEKEMSVWIPFADGSNRDGVGDLLDVTGINTERHRKNPIVLFDHGKQVALPVALTEDRNTKAYTVEIDPISRSAKANCFFYQGSKGLSLPTTPDESALFEFKKNEYQHALFCEQLYDLIAKGYVRAGSIGYQVINATKLYPDYEKGTPEGLYLKSVRMLECSAVVLPANGDTVRKALSLSSICGKKLSPLLVKSLSPYLPDTPEMVSVPLANLGNTKIPPARWKPGVGATKEMLPGGKASGKTPGDFDEEQLRIGTSHEMEHTENEELAREIAMDHLSEDPHYYQKLASIEKSFPRKSLGDIRSSYRRKSQYDMDRLRQMYNRGDDREGGTPLTDSQIISRVQASKQPQPKAPGIVSRAVGAVRKVIGRQTGGEKEMVGSPTRRKSLGDIRSTYRKKNARKIGAIVGSGLGGAIGALTGSHSSSPQSAIAHVEHGVEYGGHVGEVIGDKVGKVAKRAVEVVKQKLSGKKSTKSIRGRYRRKGVDTHFVGKVAGGVIGGLAGSGSPGTMIAGAVNGAAVGGKIGGLLKRRRTAANAG